MHLRNSLRRTGVSRVLTLSAAVLLASGSPSMAYGQGLGLFNACCPQPVCCPQPICQPIPLVQAVQVQQPQFAQVQTTEYVPETKTVQVPQTFTEYETRQVTAYRPVSETRTVNVPHVEYQTVQEMRQCTQDQGRWVTQYQPNVKVSPCEYDSRTNIFGALNRASYQVRSAFTPNYTTARIYQPNIVTSMVPSYRTVAVPTTRQLSYNVVRNEPYQSTVQVAVPRVRMVAQTITVSQPRTVMKVMPYGEALAYGYQILRTGESRTALMNGDDDSRFSRSNTGTRTADRSAGDDPAPRSNPVPNPGAETPVTPKTSSGALDEGADDIRNRGTGARNRNNSIAPEENIDRVEPAGFREPLADESETVVAAKPVQKRRAGKWIARRSTRTETGPELFVPSIAVAQNDKNKR